MPDTTYEVSLTAEYLSGVGNPLDGHGKTEEGTSCFCSQMHFNIGYSNKSLPAYLHCNRKLWYISLAHWQHAE